MTTDYDHYEAFVRLGMAGEMTWLADNGPARRRLDEDTILEGAKTVLCVARSYKRSREDEASDPAFARGLARYARGKDYHAFVRRKLRKLAEFIRRLASNVEARPMSDTAPVLERAWAARAGLGFVGKNGMIIVPGTGSLVLLGEVVTTLDLPPDTPMEERCGSCTKCLDVCPTKAFPRPFVLDPRKCLSYWTIEAHIPKPEPIRAFLGDHLFGCDDCQTVCPFNAAKSERAVAPDAFRPLERWSETSLEKVLELREDDWAAFTLGTPLRRTTLATLQESALLILAQRGGVTSLLERCAHEHPEPRVRTAAQWALSSREIV